MLPIKIELPEHFLDEEVRCGYTVTEKMKKVWAVELDLLCKLDEVCRKMGLHYFLDSGSLLGAIRDKGFIPWDDDIDVVMFRDDYEQLVNHGQQYFEEPYFLQTAYSDLGYYNCHANLRNSKTTGILPHQGKKSPINQGLFLDIFVLDGIPENREMAVKAINKQNRYRSMISLMTLKFDNSKKVKSTVKIALGLLCRILYHSPEKVYSISRKKAMKWEDSKYVDKLWWRSNPKRIHYLEKKWFSQFIMVQFEWMQFPAPANYGDVLTEYYGKNYNEPRQAPSAHGAVILDAEVSYRDYIKNAGSDEKSNA